MGLNPRSKGDDMADPRHIAGLAGPTLMAVTTSEALNLDIWSPADPTLVYLNGVLLFVAGLAITRTHNVWRLRWTLVVTLLGWAALTAGLVRMFSPHSPQLGEAGTTYAVIFLLFLVGAFLTLQAIRPGPRDPAA